MRLRQTHMRWLMASCHDDGGDDKTDDGNFHAENEYELSSCLMVRLIISTAS